MACVTHSEGEKIKCFMSDSKFFLKIYQNQGTFRELLFLYDNMSPALRTAKLTAFSSGTKIILKRNK